MKKELLKLKRRMNESVKLMATQSKKGKIEQWLIDYYFEVSLNYNELKQIEKL